MPDKKIVSSCTLCKYMRSNMLEDILRILNNPQDADRITLNRDVRMKALACVEAIFDYTENPKPSLH